MELSKKGLKAIRDYDTCVTLDESEEMARRLLAAEEQQPVAWLRIRRNKDEPDFVMGSEDPSSVWNVPYSPLYLYPQQGKPQVPDELLSTMEEVLRISDRDHELWHKAKEGIAALRTAMLTSDPVICHDALSSLIEGMEVSVDVSTCDEDADHRYFGTVTEVSELDGAKNGYILLVQDAKPNFKSSVNSPVIPDGWISVDERMPEA